MLSTVFEIAPGQDRKLVEWISGVVLTTAVWRCYHPGYKQDVVPVLIGPQGIGKSTLLRGLLPDDRHEWFSDGLSFGLDDKARVEATLGRVIVEIPEMMGHTRIATEQIKAYISRCDDGSIRLAYRPNPESMPRRFVLVGTSNDRACLPSDPSGLRRFAPVELDARCIRGKPQPAQFVRDWITEHRAQLWAEARARYDAGIPPRMPSELEMGAAAEQAERFRNADETMEEKLEAWLWMQQEKPFPLQEAMAAAGFLQDTVPTSAQGRRVSRALRQLGCRREKIQGKRLWTPPPAN